jgi:tetratricopeptide (TPR) repeat protein
MDEAALEAIRLDPLLAEAQSAMGSLHARDREWGAAETAFREALKLNPSLTTIHTDFVLSVLQPMGRHQEALRVLEEARTADPLSLDVRRVMALVQVDAGLYEDAITSARWVLERDPDFPYADLWLGRALVLSGRADEAQPIFERDPSRFGYLGYLYAVTGRRKEAEAIVAAHADSPARLMLIYGGLGDKDRAIAALEQTAAQNWWRAATWMHRPELAVLRGDPRVDAIKTRLGLPQ